MNNRLDQKANFMFFIFEEFYTAKVDRRKMFRKKLGRMTKTIGELFFK